MAQTMQTFVVGERTGKGETLINHRPNAQPYIGYVFNG